MTTSYKASSAQTLGQSWSPSKSLWSTCWRLYCLPAQVTGDSTLVQPQWPDTCLALLKKKPTAWYLRSSKWVHVIILFPRTRVWPWSFRTWGQVFSLPTPQLFLWGLHATSTLPALRAFHSCPLPRESPNISSNDSEVSSPKLGLLFIFSDSEIYPDYTTRHWL